MEYQEWLPLYKKILDDFDYSEEADREAAQLLSELRPSDPLSFLKEMEGRTVEIQGPYAQEKKSNYVISAGSAVSRTVEIGITPDLNVTDLDGDTRLQLDLNLDGVPTMIHAHGDNKTLLEQWAERFQGEVVSTAQCEPPGGLHNFGGFTDGDRAVFLADHFGAEKILLNGWDFERPAGKDGGSIKEKKLRWARRLIDIVRTPVEMV